MLLKDINKSDNFAPPLWQHPENAFDHKFFGHFRSFISFGTALCRRTCVEAHATQQKQSESAILLECS